MKAFNSKKTKIILGNRGIKAVWLAKELGITANTLCGILNGRKKPGTPLVRLMAKILNVPYSELECSGDDSNIQKAN